MWLNFLKTREWSSISQPALLDKAHVILEERSWGVTYLTLFHVGGVLAALHKKITTCVCLCQTSRRCIQDAGGLLWLLLEICPRFLLTVAAINNTKQWLNNVLMWHVENKTNEIKTNPICRLRYILKSSLLVISRYHNSLRSPSLQTRWLGTMRNCVSITFKVLSPHSFCLANGEIARKL